MPNLINELIVRELSSSFSDSEGMVFVSLAGLTVAETEAIRVDLAKEGVQLRMVRNRLARIALREQGYDAPKDLFVGNVAACWGDAEDAITAAKVLHSSAPRKAGKVALKGGVFEGSLLDEQQAVALASLPNRQELRAMLLGTIIAPAQQLVGMLNALQGSVARVLQAHVDAAGGASSEEA